MYRFEMNPLYKQATLQGIFGTFLFIALIFWPAGTFHYWQGWVFLATFAASTVGFTVYLAIYDKPLLERRLKAGPQHEKEWSQKLIVSLVFVAFFALIILPALDHRFGWSAVAPWVSVLRRCHHRALVPLYVLGHQGQQFRSIQYSGGGRPAGHRHRSVCICAPSDVRGRVLAPCRYTAGAWIVVGAWPHRDVFARAPVAASR